MQTYIQKPPDTIEDYTQKDISFDEECGYNNSFISIIIIIIPCVILFGILRKKKIGKLK